MYYSKQTCQGGKIIFIFILYLFAENIGLQRIYLNVVVECKYLISDDYLFYEILHFAKNIRK